ncbi:hypothetical protein D3C71_1555660 [compost metagenome]
MLVLVRILLDFRLEIRQQQRLDGSGSGWAQLSQITGIVRIERTPRLDGSLKPHGPITFIYILVPHMAARVDGLKRFSQQFILISQLGSGRILVDLSRVLYHSPGMHQKIAVLPVPGGIGGLSRQPGGCDQIIIQTPCFAIIPNIIPVLVKLCVAVECFDVLDYHFTGVGTGIGHFSFDRSINNIDVVIRKHAG